jgi:hypothetical protein
MRLNYPPPACVAAVYLGAVPAKFELVGSVGNEVESEYCNIASMLDYRVEDLESLGTDLSSKPLVVDGQRFQTIDAPFDERIEVNNIGRGYF